MVLPGFALAAPVTCECVRWLREERGIAIRGNAWTIKPTHSIKMATEGDVLLTTEGRGHAAEIVGFEGEVNMGTYIRPAYIKVLEANYSRCKVGTRKIAWDSPEIRGIYKALSPTTSNL
jgi:hypothetical protein